MCDADSRGFLYALNPSIVEWSPLDHSEVGTPLAEIVDQQGWNGAEKIDEVRRLQESVRDLLSYPDGRALVRLTDDDV